MRVLYFLYEHLLQTCDPRCSLTGSTASIHNTWSQMLFACLYFFFNWTVEAYHIAHILLFGYCSRALIIFTILYNFLTRSSWLYPCGSVYYNFPFLFSPWGYFLFLFKFEAHSSSLDHGASHSYSNNCT